MGLRSLLFLMEDGSHSQIMFCGTEGIFNFGKLYIGIPDGFWISLCPVGTEDIASPGFHRPLEALFVLSDGNSNTAIFFGNSDDKKRSGPAVSLKEPSYLSLHLLPVPDPAFIGLTGELCQFLFKSCDKPVENGILLFLSSEGATQDKGLTFPLLVIVRD